MQKKGQESYHLSCTVSFRLFEEWCQIRDLQVRLPMQGRKRSTKQSKLELHQYPREISTNWDPRGVEGLLQEQEDIRLMTLSKQSRGRR